MRKKIDDMHFELVLKSAMSKWANDEAKSVEEVSDSQVEFIDEKRMQSLWKKGKRKAKRPNIRIMMVLKRVAMVVISLGFALSAIAIYEPSVGANIENIIIKEYKESIAITFRKEENTPKSVEKTMKPTYIPKGWTTECVYEDLGGTIYTYRGENGEYVHYHQSIYHVEISRIKNFITKEYININGADAILMEYEDGRVFLFWYDDYVFIFDGKNVDTDTIIKIARSVK